MKWKKLVVIAGIIVAVGLVAMQQASARGWGAGPGGGFNCPWGGQPYYQMNDSDRAKLDGFRADTVELRRQIAMKRAEQMALLRNQNPDPSGIAKVQGELFDLRTEMHNRARQAGMPVMGGFQGMRGNYGMRGAGMGRQGQRMIDCPNRQIWR